MLQLDGLRGIAACAVGLLFHSRLLYSETTNPFEDVPGIAWLQIWGWSMVDLFFVLSGYIFAHCYLEQWRMRPSSTLAGFAVARVARLWPLHIALLGLAVLLRRTDPATSWENVLLSAGMLHVLIGPDPTVALNGPAWSLSVEVLCYCVFAAAATAGPRALKVATAVAIVLGAWEIAADGVWNALVGRGFLGFFAGLLLCNSKTLTDRIPTIALVPAAALPFVVVPAGNAVFLTILVAWPAAILLALRTSLPGARPFVWLGDRSYAIYLTHTLVYFVIGGAAVRMGLVGTGHMIVMTALAWMLVLAVSNALYLELERPAQRSILNRFRSGGKLSPEAAG